MWKDEGVDISDHFLIGITCGKTRKGSGVRKEGWKEKWNIKNADWIKYCREMEETKSGEIEELGRTVSEWESNIKENIRCQAKKSVGLKKFKVGKTKLKGWWDEEVAKAIADRKRENRIQRNLARLAKRFGGRYEREWVEAWDRYIKAKKEAQAVIRRKIGLWEEEQARILNEMPRREREKEAWRRLRRNLGGAGSHQDVKLKVDDREASNEEEVVPIVEGYWRRIIWQEEEEEEIGNVSIYSQFREMDSVEIEDQDIELAVRAIKTGKAGGTDGIIGEFLKYGGEALKQTLAGLFRKILEKGEVPQDWNRSRITLVHKGGGKSREDIGNYRPIAVINILAKVFGWIINEKLKTWIEEMKVLGEEQSGFRKGRGGLENVLVIKEIIERNKKLGKELYLVFLDLEKAYDRIDRKKLLTLLTHRGVDRKIVQVIKKLYEENEVKFTIGDMSTGWLKNNIGVRQGCVISPTLFNIYIEELIARIRMSGRGIEVGDRRLGCLAYADDIVLMAESKEDMEELLQLASRYGREWNVRYSGRKSKVIEFNSQEEGQWVLGNNILEVVDKYTYLGLEVSKEGIGGERQMKINEGKARKMTGMIVNAGSRSINKYEVGRSLWKGMAVPYCLYGSEITYYREGDLAKLEKTQNIVGRWGLGVPRSTAVEAIRGDMGWSTFRERVVKGKLNFLKKIEELDEDRWVKLVVRDNSVRTSWRREMDRWKRRENLEEDWNRIGPREVKKRVEESGLARWHAGMETKSTLKWYRHKERPDALKWHVGDWGSRLLEKVRTGTLEVKARNRDELDQSCSSCRGVRETIEHFLVECDKYEEERGKLIGSVKAVVGEQEWRRRLDEEEDGGVLTVLGLYQGEGKRERESVIGITKEFLVQAWGTRE